jgi:hypothetical protein
MDTKKCGHCKEILPLTNFHACKREKDGKQQWCKSCRKSWKREERLEYFKERYHADKDKYLDNFYKKNYTLSLQEYNEMLEQQKEVCKICKEPCVTGRRLAVDHCHSTGKVRGLLCTRCNSGLSQYKDRVDLLQNAIDYLMEAKNTSS